MNAQLDNEKHSLVYKVELMKDQVEEMEESFTQLQKEYKDKCRVGTCNKADNEDGQGSSFQWFFFQKKFFKNYSLYFKQAYCFQFYVH